MTPSAAASTPCPVCGGTECTLVVEIPHVPAHCNVHWPSAEAALRAPAGDLRLLFCRSCGHVFNAAFDPRLMEYTQAYENSLHFSPRFQIFAEHLADRLIDAYNLHGRHIIDIGCGKGDFLRLLCTRGENTGVGFDPSYVPDPDDTGADTRVTVVREFYSDAHAGYAADLVSCRHVLEHIREPRPFLAGIRRAIGPRHTTAVYFEVPNALYTLRDMGIWDLIYEHCSYYSPLSLRTLFAGAGFSITGIEETFGGQYLSLDAYPSEGAVPFRPAVPEELTRLTAAFSRKYEEKVSEWRHVLKSAAGEGKTIVAWGGGSKGVTFLNVLKDAAPVRALVDLNPRKQGMFVGGTGQPIVAPDQLRDLSPDIIIVMNPLYRGEIEQQVTGLGLRPVLLAA